MAACDTCGPVLEAPVAEARAWVGIGLGQTRRRGGGFLSGALARLVGSEGGRWPVMRGSLAAGPGFRRWDSDGGPRLEAHSLEHWTHWLE